MVLAGYLPPEPRAEQEKQQYKDQGCRGIHRCRSRPDEPCQIPHGPGADRCATHEAELGTNRGAGRGNDEKKYEAGK